MVLGGRVRGCRRPATILLLVYEAGLLSGKMQANLWRITSAKDPHP
jgi:hypothetical protein